jgi:glutathione S-transferase
MRDEASSMALTLYFHPLASYCHKVLIALYENDTPFQPKLVNFDEESSSAELLAHWPVGKIPVLHDSGRNRIVPETSIIIEYLDEHYPGPTLLVPQNSETALEVRLWDRFFDLYVQSPMQKIVTDVLRSDGSQDRVGVAEAHSTLRTAYKMLDAHLDNRAWAGGDEFTMADCSAAPALFYGGIVQPFAEDLKQLASYFERLLERPSVARTIREAQPYFDHFPLRASMPARFLEP